MSNLKTKQVNTSFNRTNTFLNVTRVLSCSYNEVQSGRKSGWVRAEVWNKLRAKFGPKVQKLQKKRLYFPV